MFKKALIIANLLVMGAISQAMTGEEVMQKVYDREDGNSRRSSTKMTLVNKDGKTRERKILNITKEYGEEDKSIIYFQSPPDVKGVGFLQYEYSDTDKDSDRWLYMPALRKTRRIAGSSSDDYFMGTDFTYDDLETREVEEDNHKLVREEVLDGNDCWVVESISKDKDYMYSKVISWVRKDIDFVVKAEFYDKNAKHMKTLTINNLEQVDGIWTAREMTMDNEKKSHKTILEIEEVEYNGDIKDSLFKVSSIERGRVK